jgi:hypothetical protein
MPEQSRYSFDLEEEFEWDCDLHSPEELNDEEEDD